MAQLATLDWRPVESEFVRQEFDVASNVQQNELGTTARFRDISATSGTANQYGYADFKYCKFDVTAAEATVGGHAVYLNNAVDHIVSSDISVAVAASGGKRPAGGYYFAPTDNQYGWVQINGFFPTAYATNSASIAVMEKVTREGAADDTFIRASGTSRFPTCGIVVIAAAAGSGVIELLTS